LSGLSSSDGTYHWLVSTWAPWASSSESSARDWGRAPQVRCSRTRSGRSTDR
jgi:hypothetical protein